MNPAVDDSFVALIGLLSSVLFVALYVWSALALSAMFRKMGEEPWKGWVPVLNTATVLKWGGFSPWLVLLSFIPLAGIVVYVLLIVSAHRINPGFGYGTGMTVLSALLFVVWASILGFGPARWLGARAVSRPAAPPRAPAPPPAPAAAPAIVLPAAPVAPPAPSAPPATAAASAADAASFAPPSSGANAWTPPETTPRPAADAATTAVPSVPAAGQGGDHLPDADPADDDAAWPSEIDDVSAIHPSPFPPSSAAEPSGRAYPGAPAPEDSGPIAFVPGRRIGSAPVPPASVTRVPARTPEPPTSGESPAPTASRGAAGPGSDDLPEPAPAIYAPPFRSRRAYDADDPGAFPEMSGEVSAVVGSPTAGSPRSAAAAVSAQHRRAETGEPDVAVGEADLDDDPLDVTVIARRAIRPAWELVPASGSPIPLTASVIILGRRPAGDPAFPTAQLVAVKDDARTVSKTHARIEQRGEAWVVTDLGSTNGVLVRTLMGDEVEVEPGGQLDAGERFFLGDEEFHLRRVDH